MSVDYSATHQPAADSSGSNTAVPGLSRRQFMADSASFLRGSLLMMSMPGLLAACRRAEQARQSGAAFETLSTDEAAEFSAVAERIIPSDETPGAREAGVIHFMDQVLGEDSRAEVLLQLREGLAEVQDQIAADYGRTRFHQLDAVAQDELLRGIESTPFFNTLRYLTLAGMLSMPQYGGNRNGIGFDMMDVKNQAAWGPPFGFYDRDYLAQGE